MKKACLLTAKIVLPLALFAFLLLRVDSADYEAFWNQPKHPGILLAAQFVAVTAITTSFLRWYLLVRAFDIPFTVVEALRLGFIGYMLNFVSFGSVGGDLFKAILVAKNKPEKRPEAVASVLLDRAIGLLGLVILAWISLSLASTETLTPALKYIRGAAGTVAALAVVGLLFAITAGDWFDRVIEWCKRLPLVGSAIVRMARAVRLLRRAPWMLVILMAMALVVHGLLALTVFLVSCGIYQQYPTLADHLMVVPPGMAAGALPLAPGGIGLQEGALSSLFNELDLPTGFSGMLVATVFRLVTIGIVGVGLVIYWLGHGREMMVSALSRKRSNV
ncbi:MAG: flippase-like domain-containing protein [Planctomycetales bacterium]|nr:flippase-like domain-containing protein [Planctomycetales bacterium]